MSVLMLLKRMLGIGQRRKSNWEKASEEMFGALAEAGIQPKPRSF
jgi:hypothetical protein